MVGAGSGRGGRDPRFDLRHHRRWQEIVSLGDVPRQEVSAVYRGRGGHRGASRQRGGCGHQLHRGCAGPRRRRSAPASVPGGQEPRRRAASDPRCGIFTPGSGSATLVSWDGSSDDGSSAHGRLARPLSSQRFAALAAASCTALLGDGTYYIADSSATNDASAEGGRRRRRVRPRELRAPAGHARPAQDVAAARTFRPAARNAAGSRPRRVPSSARVRASAPVPASSVPRSAPARASRSVMPPGRGRDSRTCPFGCQNGACSGACVPGERQCSGTALQTCDNTGAWQTTKTCPFVCMDPGTCSGVCSPTATQCMSSTPQTCDGTGAWVSGTPCAQPTPDCQSGACTCLAKVQTDTHNCGTCGHDCQGQACQGGLCAMESNQSSPWGIAVNAGNVYWTNTGDGTVNMAPVSGGAVTAVATSQSDPMSIVLDPTSVYWVNYAKGMADAGAVQKCALAGGCSNAPTTLAPGQTGPWGIAIDPTTAYFTAGMSVLKPPVRRRRRRHAGHRDARRLSHRCRRGRRLLERRGRRSLQVPHRRLRRHADAARVRRSSKASRTASRSIRATSTGRARGRPWG